MKLTRREHIIPQMLLRQFSDARGALWVYEKGKAVRPSKPENECTQRDFFEFELRGKKTANAYENWLSRIETDAAPILQDIIHGDMIDNITAERWATFVASLFGRTRKVRSQITDTLMTSFNVKADDPAFIRDLQYSLFKQGEFHYASDLKRAVDELRSTMNASPSYYHVAGLPNRVRMLLGPLLARSWHTIEAPSDGYFFISDCPVLTVKFQDGHALPGVGFADENTIILLPLSPKHIFIASPQNLNWKKEATHAFVNSVRHLAVQFAHRNVYADVECCELQTLVDREIDTLVFGKNAFVPQSPLWSQSE
jgi:hypothetical protein